MARYPQTVLVSCEIPWDDKEQFMEEVFRKEVRHTLQAGFKDVYVFGTAGEGYAVDTARFRRIVQVFYEETRGDGLRPMVGIITLSTANTVERIRIAYDIGFRTFQIVLPSWGALNDTEVLTYFKDVCGTFPDCKFLNYNLPRTKRVLGGQDYKRIIPAVPNLVATKTTSGGMARIWDLLRHAPELQHFVGEDNLAHGCLLGECSLLSSWGPTTARKVWEYFEACRTRQAEKAFRLCHGFHDLGMDVFGPVLSEDRIDGSYDKMIVRMGGLEELPLRLLSPYQCFSEEQYQACKRIFQTKYADWLG